MSGCRLSAAIREARIDFGNELTGMVTEGKGGLWWKCDASTRCPVWVLWEHSSVGRRNGFIWLLE